jgi:ClpP class serine protease
MGEVNTLKTGFENRGIEKMLSYGQLCIEEGFGFRCLNQYLSDLEIMRSGAPYSSLGISSRRESGLPALIQVSGASYDIISDPYILRNERLTPGGSIALIRLEGVMNSQDDASSYGVQNMATQLRYAYANKNVDAVIIEGNSGGGEVTAMMIMVAAIKERNKPVLGFGHFVASAAYGTFAAADEIIASNEMAEFGSIGAVVTINKEFLAWYKETFESFYGKDAPLKNEAMREALNGNFQPIQDVADKATSQFHSMVSGMRPLNGGENYKKATLSGKMFDADESKRRGLVDGIGNMAYAIKRAQSWATKYKSKN